jgi:hypothetical protein
LDHANHFIRHRITPPVLQRPWNARLKDDFSPRRARRARRKTTGQKQLEEWKIMMIDSIFFNFVLFVLLVKNSLVGGNAALCPPRLRVANES